MKLRMTRRIKHLREDQRRRHRPGDRRRARPDRRVAAPTGRPTTSSSSSTRATSPSCASGRGCVAAELWCDRRHAALRARGDRDGTAVTLVQGNELLGVAARADLAHQRTKVVRLAATTPRQRASDRRARPARTRSRPRCPAGAPGRRSCEQAFGERVVPVARAAPLTAARRRRGRGPRCCAARRAFVTVAGVDRAARRHGRRQPALPGARAARRSRATATTSRACATPTTCARATAPFRRRAADGERGDADECRSADGGAAALRRLPGDRHRHRRPRPPGPHPGEVPVARRRAATTCVPGRRSARRTRTTTRASRSCPAVDTQVVVAFEAGDLRRPYIVGACWNGRSRCPRRRAAPNNKRLSEPRGQRCSSSTTPTARRRSRSSMQSGHKMVLDDGAQEVKRHARERLHVMIIAAGGRSQIAGERDGRDHRAAALNVHCADGDLRRHRQLHDADRVQRRRVAVVHAGRGEHLVTRRAIHWRARRPWYRWPRQQAAEPGSRPRADARPCCRSTRPRSSSTDFLADPQHSLKFNDDDRVQRRRCSTPPDRRRTARGPPVEARRPAPGASRSTSQPAASASCSCDSHSRFYLVVCELHCDGPGFPSVGRDEVCQAGLRDPPPASPSCPEAAEPEAAEILKRHHAQAASTLAKLERRPAAARALAAGRPSAPARRQRQRARCRPGARRSRRRSPTSATGCCLGDHNGACRRTWAGSPASAVASATGRSCPTSRRRSLEDSYPLTPLIPDPGRRRPRRQRRDASTSGSCPPRAATTSPPGRRASTTRACTRSAASCAGTSRAARGRWMPRLQRRAGLERADRAVPARRGLRPDRDGAPSGEHRCCPTSPRWRRPPRPSRSAALRSASSCASPTAPRCSSRAGDASERRHGRRRRRSAPSRSR